MIRGRETVFSTAITLNPTATAVRAVIAAAKHKEEISFETVRARWPASAADVSALSRSMVRRRSGRVDGAPRRYPLLQRRRTQSRNRRARRAAVQWKRLNTARKRANPARWPRRGSSRPYRSTAPRPATPIAWFRSVLGRVLSRGNRVPGGGLKIKTSHAARRPTSSDLATERVSPSEATSIRRRSTSSIHQDLLHTNRARESPSSSVVVRFTRGCLAHEPNPCDPESGPSRGIAEAGGEPGCPACGDRPRRRHRNACGQIRSPRRRRRADRSPSNRRNRARHELTFCRGRRAPSGVAGEPVLATTCSGCAHPT